MIYRLAVESDLPTLAGMRWDFRTELHGAPEGAVRADFVPACADFLREALASGRWAIWIAEEEGHILSHVYIQRVRKVPRPGKLFAEFGYITNVYTLPDYRSRGIGATLLAHVKEWGRREKLEMFILWPSRRAVPFYYRAGFRPSPEALECPLWED